MASSAYETVLLAAIAVSSWLVTRRLEEEDERRGPSVPLQLVAFLSTVLGAAVPMVMLMTGQVEHSVPNRVIAYAAFVLLSLRRHRLVWAQKQK